MLHCLEKGEGPVRVWMHGLLGNSLNLSGIASKLSGRHLFPDARNHGRSFHDPDCTYTAMATDIMRLLDSKQIAKASLIGHSMGGRTALKAAVTWPERFEKLVIIDVCPIQYRKYTNAVGNDPRRYVRPT